jgi:hypothetical protein
MSFSALLNYADTILPLEERIFLCSDYSFPDTVHSGCPQAHWTSGVFPTPSQYALQ